MNIKRKMLTYFLIITLLITGLPLDSLVYAANEPEITNISLVGVTYNGERTLMYKIYGKNFNNPEFWINGKLINSNGYVKADDGSYLIINNSTNNDLFQSDETYSFIVRNSDGTESLAPVDFTLKLVPWVTSVSKAKVYIDEELTIYGTGIVEGEISKLVIGGNPYDSTEFTVDEDEQSIFIPKVKSAQFAGAGDISIIKYSDEGHEIQGIYREAVTVVGRLEGVEVSKIEPNAGSVFGGTRVRILGTEGKSNFREDMHIYVDSISESTKFTDIELVYDDEGNLRGISGITPKSPTSKQGVFNIIITDFTGTNELTVENAYTYEDKENLLRLSTIVPPYGKEASVDETVEISGRNIITLNIPNLVEWVEGKTFHEDNTTIIDAPAYYDYQNKSAYIVNYLGKYRVGQDETEYNVKITREIKLILGKTTEITEFGYSQPLDSVVAVVPSVDEPGPVNVTMQTTTTVWDRDTGEYILSRSEEFTLENGFTFLPATTTPVIETIEPSKGPIDELIYLTIKGENFQVLYKQNPDEDPDVDGDEFITVYPVIQIGSKIIDPNQKDADDQIIDANLDWIEIYDDNNNLVNGIGRILGTTIKTAIQAHGNQTAHGLVDVFIKNPDEGQTEFTDDPSKKFEFLKHNRTPEDMPVITKVTPNMGSLEGGNTITIEGSNFDFQQSTPDVIVTIDGQKATIVNATSTKITAIVPPGLSIGEKPIQLITEDGAMDSIDPNDPEETREGYTYIRVLANPEIESIAPSFGGEGTIVYIFGRDKGEDNPNFFEPDPDGERLEERLGTRVFFNDIEIDTERITVLDKNTLRINIPGGFAPGFKDVKILNPDTSSVIIEDGFNYKKPPEGSEVEITSIEPNLGSNSGGDYITITGSNFKDGAKVYFGGREASFVTVSAGRDKIYLSTPPYPISNPDLEPSKSVDVTVVNYDGSSFTSSPENGGGYTYMVPQSEPYINQLEPSSGTTIGGEYVTIEGRDFRTYSQDGFPVPPKVYFGGIPAKEVIYMNDTELLVVTPFYGGEGGVDVTVVNPGTDFGVYTKQNGYTYRMTKPIIDDVLPEKGHKKGGQEIVIKGKELLSGDFSDELQGETLGEDTPIIHILAIFGDERDEDRVIPQTVEGEIIREASNILGDITIDYKSDRQDPIETIDGDMTTDSVLIYHRDIAEPIAHFDLESDERHLFILDWGTILGEDLGAEGVMVELRDDTLSTRRRIAPRAEVLDAIADDGTRTLLVQTPPAEYVGVKNLYIENKDRGWSSTQFEYVSPASSPVIDNIIPRSEITNPQDEVIKYYVESTVEGGLYITIEGYDFRQNVEVFIEGVLAPLVSRVVLSELDDEGRPRTRIVVKAPKGRIEDINKELRIMVVNQDGGFADATLLPIPYYFVYRIPESKPYIESILPVETSQAGGNSIKIVGYDFRTGATVLIDGKECAIEHIDNDEIIITTPTDLTPGTKDVQIINRDFGTMTKTAALTVVSYPFINQINFESGEEVERVSIEGGEVIVINGQNFQNGAKVIIGGTRALTTGDTTGDKGLFRDDKYYKIEDGYQAQKVEFVDENKLIVTLPEVLKEDDYTVSIINPDGGLSNDNETIEYTVPIPSDPVGLKAEIVNEKYIRIYGYISEQANYYEIYAYLGDDYPHDDEFEYLDTTEKNSYRITKFKDVDDDEDIYLRIRAVNKYGPSQWSDTVKISYRELEDIDGIGDEDEDGDLTSNYKETIGGDGLNILIGDRLRGSDYSLYNIDLRDGKYKNINKRIINIPRKVIRESSRTILVDNGDSRIQFKPQNFIFNIDSSDSSYGKLIVERLQGIYSEQISIMLPRKYKPLSKIYSIQTAIQTDRNIRYFTNINGTMDIEISYDEQLLGTTDEGKLQIFKFDSSLNSWTPLPGGIDKNRNVVYARVSSPGEFVILGAR